MDHSEKHIVTTPDRPFPWQIPTPWARANENTQSPVPCFNWDILVLLAAKAPHLLPKTLQTQIHTPSWSLNQVQSRNSGVSESKRRMCLVTCSVDEGWAKTRTEELDECHHFEVECVEWKEGGVRALRDWHHMLCQHSLYFYIEAYSALLSTEYVIVYRMRLLKDVRRKLF